MDFDPLGLLEDKAPASDPAQAVQSDFDPLNLFSSQVEPAAPVPGNAVNSSSAQPPASEAASPQGHDWTEAAPGAPTGDQVIDENMGPAKTFEPEKEARFQDWFKGWARHIGINENPDHPRAFYDYRAAYDAGVTPERDENGRYHWDSGFKLEGHPNRYVNGVDTITNQKIPEGHDWTHTDLAEAEELRGKVDDLNRALADLDNDRPAIEQQKTALAVQIEEASKIRQDLQGMQVDQNDPAAIARHNALVSVFNAKVAEIKTQEGALNAAIQHFNERMSGAAPAIKDIEERGKKFAHGMPSQHGVTPLSIFKILPVMAWQTFGMVPGAGVESLIRFVETGGDLDEAKKRFDQVVSFFPRELLTDDEIQGMSALGEVLGKPFEMIGKGAGKLAELADLPWWAQAAAGTAAEFAAVMMAPKVFRMAKDSTWYREMTIPERGLAIQTIDDMLARGYTQEEILKYYPGSNMEADAARWVVDEIKHMMDQGMSPGDIRARWAAEGERMRTPTAEYEEVRPQEPGPPTDFRPTPEDPLALLRIEDAAPPEKTSQGGVATAEAGTSEVESGPAKLGWRPEYQDIVDRYNSHVEKKEVFPETRDAIQFVLTEVAPRLNLSVTNIEHRNEEMEIDPSTPEGYEFLKRFSNYPEEEIQDAIQKGDKFFGYAYHQITTGPGGRAGSTITTFSGATPFDIFHDTVHAVAEQGGLPGWKGNPEEIADHMARLFEQGREQEIIEFTGQGSRVGEISPHNSAAMDQLAASTRKKDEKTASTSDNEPWYRDSHETANISGQPVEGDGAQSIRTQRSGNVVRHIRRSRPDVEKSSWSYSGGGPEGHQDARVLENLGITFVNEWRAGEDLARLFKADNISTPRFLELEKTHSNAQKFSAHLTAIKDAMGPYGECVAVHPVEDYQGMRLLLADDGKSCVAIKADGDMISLASSAGAGRSCVEAGIAAGGLKLDCFDSILPELYSAHGFKAVARLPWDDAQAPAKWDKRAMAKFNDGEPDVVFMVRDPKYFDIYQAVDGKKCKTWDEAVAEQEKEINNISRYSIRRKPQTEEIKTEKPETNAQIEETKPAEFEKIEAIPETEEPEETTGIKNRKVAEDRAARGLDAVEKLIISDKKRASEGKRLVNSGEYDPRAGARAIINNPRQVVPAEIQAALLYDKQRLRNDAKEVQAAIIEAVEKGDKATEMEMRQRLAKIEDDFENNEQATTFAGTSASAALRIRVLEMREDYSLVNTINRLKAAIGVVDPKTSKIRIPKQIRLQVEQLTKDLDKALEDLKVAEARASKLEAERFVREARRQAQREVKKTMASGVTAAKKAALDKEFGALSQHLAQTLGKLHAGIDPTAIPILVQMAKNRIMAGIESVDGVVDTLYDEVKDIIDDVTKRDVRDAISGYGVTAQMSQDEINVKLREVKRQARLLSALEDAQEGLRPLRSGLQRDKLSDEVRRLQKDVVQAMRESGIDAESTMSPGDQWRNSLEAVKTRLRNQISDLAAGVEKKKNAGIVYDEEARALQALRDIMKATEPPEKVPMPPDQLLRNAIAAVHRSIAEYEERIANKELEAKAKESRTPETPELKALREHRDNLRKQLDALRKEAHPAKDPVVRATEAAVKATERSITDLERRIREKDLSPKKVESKVVETPELKVLREKREQLVGTLKEMRKAAEEPRDPLAIALKAYKKRLSRQIEDLEKRLDTGDFTKAPRRTIVLDPEAQRAKEKVGRLKQRIDEIIEMQRLANRTRFEKGLDYFVKWRRFVILSSVKTLWKLTAAATMRQISTPLEEAIGMVLSKIPGVKEISQRAPREGGASIRAEAKAFSVWFERETYADMVKVAKTGKSQLDVLYGKKRDLPPEALDFFGHIHGALKITPKRAEFFRSLEKRAQFAVSEGKDITDPNVQMGLAVLAYEDANRAIFMNDNMMTAGWRMLLGHFRRQGPMGRTLAAMMQVLLPIVKVPTNFAIEMEQGAAGYVNAIGKLLITGFEKMTPKDFDYVMRCLKKNTLGLIFVLIGYIMYESIGGFYQKGEKRKDGTEPKSLTVGDVVIPRILLHHPLMELLQLGATIHRVEEDRSKKHKGGIGSGLLAGGVGILEEIPFFEQPVRVGEALKDADKAGIFLGELSSSLVIPPDVANLAKLMDEGTKRTPKSFGDVWASKIPGVRETVARSKKTLRQAHLSIK